MLLADRLLGMPYAREVKERFRNALEEEFTTQDGTILPIRSELTGWTVCLSHATKPLQTTRLTFLTDPRPRRRPR